MLRQPRVPSWVARDVRAIVVEQIGLDIGLAWPTQEPKFVGPAIAIDRAGIGVRAETALPRGGERKEILPQTDFLGKDTFLGKMFRYKLSGDRVAKANSSAKGS